MWSTLWQTRQEPHGKWLHRRGVAQCPEQVPCLSREAAKLVHTERKRGRETEASRLHALNCPPPIALALTLPENLGRPCHPSIFPEALCKEQDSEQRRGQDVVLRARRAGDGHLRCLDGAGLVIVAARTRHGVGAGRALEHAELRVAGQRRARRLKVAEARCRMDRNHRS